MKRYVLCPVEKIVDAEGRESYFARVRRYSGISFVAVIPTGQDGRPLFNWALVIVGKDTFNSLPDDANLDFLPDGNLNALVAMPASLKSKLTAKYGESNLPDTIRLGALIRRLGRKLHPQFDESALTVSED